MIVFDLDDTLYLERDFAFSGYRHLGAEVRLRYGVAGFEEACRTLFLEGERRRILDRACERLDWAGGAAHVADLILSYRHHTPRITLCPDASDWLARHGAADRLGLITDGPAQTQGNKVAALGLAGRIGQVCLTGSLGPGLGKPHPHAFALMEQAAGGGQMVYVADNPAKDFVTPRARGWLTVQIVRVGAIHDPSPPDAGHAAHLQIASLDQLDEALETAGA